MLFGSILQKEPAIAVTFRLIDVKSGNILGSQRLAGYSPDKIFSLVDTIAFLVTDILDVLSEGRDGAVSVADVTTKSPEAYRSYVEGVGLNERYYTAEAVAAFKRAIELDSTFAMAYFGLANVNLSTLSNREGNEALSKAYALRASATERERLAIESDHAAKIERNIPRALSTLETLVQKYPRQQSAYLQLANYYGESKQYEKVVATYKRGLEVDSLDKNLWNSIAYVYVLLGRKAEAFQAIDRYLELAPAEANPYDSKGDIYAMADQGDSAVVWWGKAVAFRGDFPSALKLSIAAFVRRDDSTAAKYYRQFTASKGEEARLYEEEYPFYVLIRDGRLAEARKRFLESLASHRARKLQSWVEGDLAAIVTLDYELGDAKSMIDHAGERVSQMRKEAADIALGRWELAIAYAKAGKPELSRQLADSLREALAGDAGSDGVFEYGMALLAFEEGEYERAQGLFESATKSFYPNHAPLYFRAVCRLKTGHVQEAIAEFDRLSRTGPIDFVIYDHGTLPMSEYRIPIGTVKAHYWLGVAYEAAGTQRQGDQSV